MTRWRTRLGHEAHTRQAAATLMRAHNPAVIPRNHRVEAVLDTAVHQGDCAPLEAFLAVLATPCAVARTRRRTAPHQPQVSACTKPLWHLIMAPCPWCRPLPHQGAVPRAACNALLRGAGHAKRPQRGRAMQGPGGRRQVVKSDTPQAMDGRGVPGDALQTVPCTPQRLLWPPGKTAAVAAGRSPTGRRVAHSGVAIAAVRRRNHEARGSPADLAWGGPAVAERLESAPGCARTRRRQEDGVDTLTISLYCLSPMWHTRATHAAPSRGVRLL